MSSTCSRSLGGAAADHWAVWINRHVMIAFTTMMWMAPSLVAAPPQMFGRFCEHRIQIANDPYRTFASTARAVTVRRDPLLPAPSAFGRGWCDSPDLRA